MPDSAAALTVFTCWKKRWIPQGLRRCAESLGKLNPNHPAEISDDAECLRLVDRLLPGLPPELRRGVLLADIWRCAKLLENPGIYTDLDIEWIQPVGALLVAARAAGILREDTEVLLTTDHPFHERRNHGGRRIYMNDFMIALRPNCALFQKYLRHIGSLSQEDVSARRGNPVTLTGPEVLTRMVETAGGPESLKVGVLPWQWIHPLPDMTIDFPEWNSYDALIRNGDWCARCGQEPFAVHHWWHSYMDRTMLGMYGDQLYQTDANIAERRLRSMAEKLGGRAESTGMALAEFAQNGGGVVIDLDPLTSASGGGPSPALTFMAAVAEALQGLPVDYHGVDPNLPCDKASHVTGKENKGAWQYHATTPMEFLREWSGTASLIRMGDGGADRAANVDAARVIVNRGLVRSRGQVLIGSPPPNGDGGRPVRGDPQTVFKQAGFQVASVAKDGGETRLEAPPAPPTYGAIPKIIHQTWKNLDVIQPFRREWADSWMEVNAEAGWEYRFWTDEDIDGFVATEFPEFYETFSEYDVHIKRVDAVRYLILKRIGGVYADLDSICLRPLDELLEGRSLVFGCQLPFGTTPFEIFGTVCNAIMAGAPAHPFWNGVETHMAQVRDQHVLSATGPDFLTTRIKDSLRYLPTDAFPTLLRREAFYPIEWNSPLRSEMAGLSRAELASRYPESISMNFWTGTWLKQSPSPATHEPSERFSRNNREYRDRPREMVLPAVNRSSPVDLLAHLVEHQVATVLTHYGPCSDGDYQVPAESLKRTTQIPTLVTAVIASEKVVDRSEGGRDEAFRRFAQIENPLVFFAEDEADLELMREIRASNRHSTQVIGMNRAGLRVFSQLEKLMDSTRFDASPNLISKQAADLFFAEHAKYELMAQAIETVRIGTSHCCWLDFRRVLESLNLVNQCTYQLHHRASLGCGVHYTRAHAFKPLPPGVIGSEIDGGRFCLAKGFFYGEPIALANWCETYVEHALLYLEAGHILSEEATLHALLSEGLAAEVTTHVFPDNRFGLCDLLLTAVAPPIAASSSTHASS
ncbi:MAG: glycosyltransferase [Verrucomicrobiota bacterium]